MLNCYRLNTWSPYAKPGTVTLPSLRGTPYGAISYDGVHVYVAYFLGTGGGNHYNQTNTTWGTWNVDRVTAAGVYVDTTTYTVVAPPGGAGPDFLGARIFKSRNDPAVWMATWIVDTAPNYYSTWFRNDTYTASFSITDTARYITPAEAPFVNMLLDDGTTAYYILCETTTHGPLILRRVIDAVPTAGDLQYTLTSDHVLGENDWQLYCDPTAKYVYAVHQNNGDCLYRFDTELSLLQVWDSGGVTGPQWTVTQEGGQPAKEEVMFCGDLVAYCGGSTAGGGQWRVKVAQIADTMPWPVATTINYVTPGESTANVAGPWALTGGLGLVQDGLLTICAYPRIGAMSTSC